MNDNRTNLILALNSAICATQEQFMFTVGVLLEQEPTKCVHRLKGIYSLDWVHGMDKDKITCRLLIHDHTESKFQLELVVFLGENQNSMMWIVDQDHPTCQRINDILKTSAENGTMESGYDYR